MPADTKPQELHLTGSSLFAGITEAESLKRWGNVATACEILCAAILIGTAFLKLLSLAWNQPILYEQDPIIPLTNRTVFILVVFCEALIALRLLLSRSGFEKCALLVWITLCFSIYRLGLWVNGVREPCSCLGDGLGYWSWLSENRDAAATIAFCGFIVLTTLRLVTGLKISAIGLAGKKHQPQKT